MTTTYDVRIWSIGKYKGQRKTSYMLRWRVGNKRQARTFETWALADSFRSSLVAAARRGEAFDEQEGLPTTRMRTAETVNWFTFACSYVDMKWTESSPGHRRSVADALVPITMAMLTKGNPPTSTTSLRRALRRAFSYTARAAEQSQSVTNSLRWVERNIRPVSDLAQPEALREVLAQISVNLDGTAAATNTVRRRRTTLSNALDYAVERQLLPINPLRELKTSKRITASQEVDRRVVANPGQVHQLLEAVGQHGKTGPPLVAFFALLYYAALRPEEAASIRRGNLEISEQGWGQLHLDRATPEVGAEWTNSGRASEERGLKHRADGSGRVVPCPPELTQHLNHHLATFGTARDGRLFRGARHGGRIGSTTYGRVWANARTATFTPEIAAGPLAKRPYDLRHAAVSTWLNAGVEATRAAQWAGHSVAVLLRVYAKCLDGGESTARHRVEEVLSAHR